MTVTVRDLVNNFDLEILVSGNLDTNISVSDINRPGLQFAGFYDYYDNKRVQIVGKTEWSFLESLSSDVRKERLSKFFS